jgi:hypothetical protein
MYIYIYIYIYRQILQQQNQQQQLQQQEGAGQEAEGIVKIDRSVADDAFYRHFGNFD